MAKARTRYSKADYDAVFSSVGGGDVAAQDPGVQYIYPTDEQPSAQQTSTIPTTFPSLNDRRKVMGVDAAPLSDERQWGQTAINTVVPAPAMAIQQTGKSLGGLVRWAGDLVDSDMLAGAGKNIADTFEKRQQALSQEYDLGGDLVPESIRSGLVSVGQMVLPAGAGALKAYSMVSKGGNLADAVKMAGNITIGTLSAQTAGDAYDKYRDRGHNILTSSVGGVTEGGIEYVTERLGMSRLLNYLGEPAKRGIATFAKMIGRYMLDEQLSEQLATHGQSLTDMLIGDPNEDSAAKTKRINDYFTQVEPDGMTQFAKAAASTAIATATMTTVTGGAGGAIRHLFRDGAATPGGGTTDVDLIGSANTAGGTGGSSLERRMNQRGIRKELDDIAAAAARELGTGYVEGINLDGAQQIPAEQPQPALQATAGPNVTNLLNFYADQSTGVVDAENATPADRALTQQRLDRMELAPALGDRLVQEPQQTGPVENPEVVPKSPEQVEAERYTANVTARDAALNKAIELEAQIAALGIESKRPDIHPEQRANLLKEINRLKKDFKAEDGMARFHDAAVKQMEKQRAAAAKAAEAAKPPKLDTQPTADMYSGLANMQTVGRNIPTGYEEVAGQDGRGGFKPIQKKQPASVPVAANEPNPVYTVLNDKITSLLDDIKTGKHTAASAFQELRANPWYDEAATYQAEVEGNDLESEVYAQFEAAEQDQPTGVPEVQAASAPSEVALPETPLQPADDSWTMLYESLAQEGAKTVIKGKSSRGNWSESEFSKHIKQFYQQGKAAYDRYGKQAVLKALENKATGKKLTAQMQEIVDAFQADMDNNLEKLRMLEGLDQAAQLSDAELEMLGLLEQADVEEFRSTSLDDILADLFELTEESAYNELEAAIRDAQKSVAAALNGGSSESQTGNMGQDNAQATGAAEGKKETGAPSVVPQSPESSRPSGDETKPRSEVVSTSGEVQNKLFATPPAFGKKPKTGSTVSTSDLLDGFTNEDEVQPSLVAQPEAPKTATKGDIELEFNKRYLELYRQGGIEASRADDLIEDYAERPDVQTAFDMEADELTEHFDALAQDVRTKHQKSNKAKFSLDRVLVEYGQGAADAAIAETPKGRADVEQVAAQFGKKIVWYTGKTDRMKNTGGMYLHTDPDTIYLNAESRTPSMFILGHELTHALKRQAPDLYKRLQDIAFHSSGLAGYRAEYEKTRKDLQGDALNELVDEEMRADVVGTMFTKRTFWDELMAKSPRLFRTVAKFVSDILGRITRDIKAPSALLMKSDAGQVSTLVAEVMQEYADRMNTTVEQAFAATSTPQLAAASTAEIDTAPQTLAFEERDEQTKYAHAVLDKIKDYWSDFVDTTAVLGDNFRTLRYLAKGAVAMAEEKARLHHDRLKKFRGNDVVNKQVYAYLTTKDADANMITNAQAREAAIDSKNEIIAIGRELVRRGLMKEEALWEHEGSYLPRLYAAHVIGADAYGEMYATDTTGSKKLNRDYLNRRKDIPQDVRDLILGEIKDPAYLVSMALAKPLRDIALHQWMKQIATVKEWAMPKLLVDWNMSTSPTYQIGNMAYTKNENGTYNITETAYKRVWDEVKAVDMNFIKERLGRNVAKLVMQTAKTNKQVEFGQLKYKLRPDGLYDLKLQRREATETHHDNIAEADLAGIVGEQRAGWMRSGTITSQRGERPVRTVGGRQVTPFYLAKEAARLRDMVAQKALPDDSLRLADRMERTAREALRDAGFDFNDNMELKAGTLPDQWRQLPDTAAYGPLRGMVVRKQIYNDIVGQPGNANTQLRGLVGMLFGENGLLNVSHRVWKAVKTTLNPGTHAANFMSNAVLMHINTDMKAHQVPQYLVKAVNAMATKNRMFREAQKYGFTSAGFAVNEIGRINTELIEYMAKQDQAAHPMQMVKFIAGKFYNQAGDIYQLGETLFKTAVLIHGIENGKHPAEAAIEAQDALMDYSDVSASVRFLRQYMLGAPFLTFTFKVTEQLAKNTIKNGRNVFEAMRADMGVVDKAFAVWRGTQYTRKLATWTTLLKLAPGVAASMIGLGDDEWEKLKASLPDWAKARGHFLLMPWQNDDGTYTWWDISRWHPIDPLVNIAGSLIGSEGEAHPMRAMGVLGGPIPQVVTTLVTAIAGDGIDPFTGRAIAPSREGLTKSEVFARYMNYAINMTTPSIMFGIGADIADVFGMNSMSDVSGVPSNKLVGYLTGKRSARTGNQTTMGEALAPLAGSNVYNLDPRFEASKKLQSMRLEMIGLRSNMQKALASPNMKDADRDRTISYWQEKISRLQKKMSDYSDATN